MWLSLKKQLACGLEVSAAFRFGQIENRNQQEADPNELLHQGEGRDQFTKRHLSTLNQTEWVDARPLVTNNAVNKSALSQFKQARYYRPNDDGHA